MSEFVLYGWGVILGIAVAVADVCVKERRGKRHYDDPQYTRGALTMVLCWWLAIPWVGPVWAMLAAPAVFTGMVLTLATLGYAAERLAKVRVARREAGR